MKFRYTASDKKGKRIQDVITADNMPDVLSRLKNEGLLPLKIDEVLATDGKLKSKKSISQRQVKSKDVVVFTRQLSATLSAGLLLSEALATIADDLENIHFREIIIKIKESIQSGQDFSSALSKYPKVFPITYTSIIQSGEMTGNLDKVMTDLAKYLENSERMREKVKSALRYPMFIFGFAFFVVSIIVLFLIPKFKSMFSSAGAKLPLLTRIVVNTSDFFLHNWLLFFLLSIALWFLFLFLMRYPKVKFFIDGVKFKIPIVGKAIIYKAALSRFCQTLGILIAGGVGLSSALEITGKVVNNLVLEDAIEKIRIRVISGASLSDEIKAQPTFPRLVSKMASVGERTGRVDDMLKRAAGYYEDELETSLQNLTVLLEPALIVFIGGIVLIVVLALYLPIFHLSSAIR